jgi:hypothetical protein
MRYVALVLAVTAFLCACASGTGGSGARPQENLITAEEIAESQVNYAYWLVWRPGRSSTDPKPLVPVAFLDNTYLGDLDQLWTIVASEILEIRYLNDREAVYRYGTTYNSGIIQVIRR